MTGGTLTWPLAAAALIGALALGYVVGAPRHVSAWLVAQQFQRTEPDLGLDPEPSSGVLGVLVVGTDARDDAHDLSPAEQVSGRRADTVVLVLAAEHGLTAIAIPRDVRVHTRSHAQAKLSATLDFSRSDTVDAVRSVTGLPVHRYIEVSFAALVDLVDELGGVTVHLDTPLSDDTVGLRLPAGTVLLDGAHALQFARARHPADGPDGSPAEPGDLPRIHRGQVLARAVLERLQQADPKGAFATLLAVRSAATSITVDPGLSAATLQRLTLAVQESSADLAWCVVPTVPQTPGLSAASPFPPQHPGSLQFRVVDADARTRMVNAVIGPTGSVSGSVDGCRVAAGP